MRHILALCLVATAQTGAVAAQTVVDGFALPESVLVAGDRRFVSNIGATFDPTAKDGDGFISELAADGTVLNRRALPADGTTLDAPKGMAIDGDRLYVTDIDRVVGFDLASGHRSFEAALPPGAPPFANDLAATGDGALLVSATTRNAVYRLDLATGGWTLLTDAIPGANGIVYDPETRTALVAGLGADFGGGDLFLLPDAGEPQRLPEAPHGLLDGLARLPDGRIVVSDWVSFDPPAAGRLLALPAGGGAAQPLGAGITLAGPADFAVDATGALWVPSMIAGTVTILPTE